MQHIDKEALLSTAYLPNIQYVSKFLLHKSVNIEVNETYLKQSYRNRFTILGSNGPLDLSIPVIRKEGNRTITKDILIDYATKWQLDHWKAIKSAYGNSPFFEIFEPEFAHLFEEKEKFLIDFNDKALQQIFQSLGLNICYKRTKEFLKPTHNQQYDFRESINPKKRLQKPDPHFNQHPYFQVFSQKLEFHSNLSFIDLMFNEGPQAIDICLKSIIPKKTD